MDPNPSLKRAPPLAGGGRPSRQAELERVTSLSPAIQAHLKKIYAALTAKRDGLPVEPSDPPLSSAAEFEAWFLTPAAGALAAPTQHDHSYPISSYFISSSHNTYLSGNQLYGAASGEAYRNVLLRGCRCLEIDVWDGDDDDSSVSSSDLDELQPAGLKVHRTESRKDRANSALTRFTHRVKDKTAHMRQREPSPRPNTHAASAAEHQMPSDQVLAEAERLKNEPRVYHGYTLTKDVSFRAVCHAIKESAFEATDMPIIVSLEVHCSLDQQEIMVEIMQHVFRDHLVDTSKQDASAIHALPSPDQLRKKILVKVKWTPSPQSDESNNPLDHLQSGQSKASEGSASPEKKKKASKILQALSDLGVYTRAYSFKHFSQPEAKIPTHVFSLSEAKVEDIHSDPEHGPALFEHNRHFLMRVFPSGLRVNSSNVEPCFLWRQGAQMVALNWQKLDKGTMLNEGMFAGEEGWVLKPEGFRSAGPKPNGGPALATTPQRCLLDLDIEIVAAQKLPLPLGKDRSHLEKMKPYIKLQLHVDTHGPPGQGSDGEAEGKHANLNSKYDGHFRRRKSGDDEDEEARRLKRKSKSTRSWNPDFGGELMQWKGIHDVVDELSFLRLKINDDRAIGKDELIAWACIKLSRLKNGYRFVHLLDASGAACDGALLIRINKTLHV